MVHIYIVNGFPGSGKTTFENMVKAQMVPDYCWIISTIDPIKKIAKEIGWNGVKGSKDRKFLSDLKDLCSRYNDFSFKYVLKKINDIETQFRVYDMPTDNVVVFIDCREPFEIEQLRDWLGAKTVFIDRGSIDKDSCSNHADREVLDVRYDLIVENNGSLRDLELGVKTFLREEGIEKTQ